MFRKLAASQQTQALPMWRQGVVGSRCYTESKFYKIIGKDKSQQRRGRDMSLEELRKYDFREYKINDEVDSNLEVRLILNDENRGIMSADAARQECKNAGLDFVLMNTSVKPPVSKGIIFRDYLLKLRESTLQKEATENKRRPKSVKHKELRLSPKTAGADFDRLMKQGRHFLANSMELKVFIKFKPGQRRYQQEAIDQLDKVVEYMKDLGIPQSSSYKEIERDENGRIIYKPLAVTLKPAT